MTAPAPLSFAEVGARWPEALVLWDRDVAACGWTPVFWEKPAPRFAALKLFAFDTECRHATGTHAWEGIVWGACRCVMWTGEAWITMSAERYEAVRAALRGERIPLERRGSQMLWYMIPYSCAAEITPSSFIVPYIISGRSDHYELSLAAGIVSSLLDGVGLPDTGHAIRRIRLDAQLIRDGVPAWNESMLGARYVRIDDVAGRTVIRIRASEADLADLGPEVPVVDPQRFVVLDRTCPYCGRIPERYRVLRGGSHVCLACGRSVPPP
jgi:hypothetical protein